MRAIVTGATGFIGAALCRELLEKGYCVTAVIRPQTRKRRKLEQLLAENLNYRNKLQIVEILLEDIYLLSEEYHIQADVFYHLAWNGSVGADREEFLLQYPNIQYTIDAIHTAKACGCSKIIGAGSQAEYGVARQKAGEDTCVPNPFMMYGAAKLSAYYMGNIVASQIGISLVWPRIYSVYGVGEQEGILVDYVIHTLYHGGVPQLTACENMWNYLYITDCVRALRLLGESKSAYGVYNIASRDSRRLKEFVLEIKELIAPNGALNFEAKQANEKRTFWLNPDCSKLERLGFCTEIDFKDGIQKILEEIRG